MRVRILVNIVLTVFICCGCQSQQIYKPLFVCTSKLCDSYGICTHVNRKGPKYEFDTRNQDLAMIRSTGASFIRTDWDWPSLLSSEKGKYSFEHFDKLMKSVNDERLNALAIVTLRPNYNNSSIEEWKEHLKEEVRHYKQIRNWEVLNEVDIIRTWNPDIYANDYVELLKNGYKIIKEQNKKAKVVFSGLANSDSRYLDSILCENVCEYFDIMNVHRYNNKSSEPEELLAYFQRLYDKLEVYGVKKPVWLTECGCSTAEGWASEEVQANRLPRIFLISYACGINKVFWYKSRSREIDSSDKEDFFGLWHKDYSPKPAFYAYQTLVRMCPDKSTRPKLVRHGNVYMASWKRPDGKKAWALWTSKKEEKMGLIIKGIYKIYDMKGNEINKDGGDFDITPSVIYIVGDQRLELEIEK